MIVDKSGDKYIKLWITDYFVLIFDSDTKYHPEERSDRRICTNRFFALLRMTILKIKSNKIIIGMLIGEYKHILDAKKRLAIPVKFRRFFSQGAVITRGIDNCLILYPLKEWESMAGKLGQLPASQIEARSFARIMLAGAMAVKFDRLGRILVPDYLKKYAFLKKRSHIFGSFLVNLIQTICILVEGSS